MGKGNGKPKIKWQMSADRVVDTIHELRGMGVTEIRVHHGADLPPDQVYLKVTCADLTERAKVLNKLAKR